MSCCVRASRVEGKQSSRASTSEQEQPRMGIKGLQQLINDIAPHAVKQVDIKSLFGRKIAIDASVTSPRRLAGARADP